MKMILAVVVAAAFVMPARAEEKTAPVAAKSGWASFFKNLKNSLSQSAVGGERKKGRGAQGVAAVRGKEQSGKTHADPNEPGIKGDIKSSRARRDDAYDREFEVAVDLIEKGKFEEGLKGLETFKSAHPKHRPDEVEKAIEGVKALMSEKNAVPADVKP